MDGSSDARLNYVDIRYNRRERRGRGKSERERGGERREGEKERERERNVSAIRVDTRAWWTLKRIVAIRNIKAVTRRISVRVVYIRSL